MEGRVEPVVRLPAGSRDLEAVAGFALHATPQGQLQFPAWVSNMTSRLTSLRPLLPLLLVIAALVGSVVIPARQTWRILALLRETTEGLAPAKLITAELQSALVDEFALVRQNPDSTADSTAERYEEVAAANGRRLERLRRIGSRLDTASAESIRRVAGQIPIWWAVVHTVEARPVTRRTSEARLHAAAIRHDSVMRSLARLSATLSAETVARDERVRGLERASLLWNIVLVIAAFAALLAVTGLSLRERRALAQAERRSHREAALREAAERMAGAYSLTEAMQAITEAADRIVDGRAAFIHEVVPAQARPAAAGSAALPGPGASETVTDSLTQTVLDAGHPIVADASAVPGVAAGGQTVLAIPLGGAQQPLGALFVLSGEGRRFRSDDVAYAATFGHLASLALQKVRVLEEARNGRAKLERVLASRSRLIRGFSHDVKNPIGAADGFAALLHDGIYGELSAAQLESVGHIRRSLHSALSLIEDLHELASAETGHLTVTRGLVDVNQSLAGLIEEYQAAARAGGLALTARLDADLPSVTTSALRLEQIVSNLLSNAIKYTAQGSVVVETRLARTDPSGIPGDWIQVQVADTGPGIPRDKQEFIFEEFSRISPRDKPGAGLGLAISRLLAGALGGYITLDSQAGCGSRFILWLPVG